MSRAGLSVSMNLLVSMQISCTDSINCVSTSLASRILGNSAKLKLWVKGVEPTPVVSGTSGWGVVS